MQAGHILRYDPATRKALYSARLAEWLTVLSSTLKAEWWWLKAPISEDDVSLAPISQPAKV